MSISRQDKMLNLMPLLMGYDQLAVAFSGGVDSMLLLLAAREALGPGVIAVTAAAPNVPKSEIDFTHDFCEEYGITHLVINAEPEFI
ncbi:MAG: hypothetical protein ACRCUS_09630, partial [Anaerovoracaceae bacterium]